MIEVGQIEKRTQDRIISLFKDKLDYTYLGNLEHADNKNVREDLLKRFLKEQGWSDFVIDAVMQKFVNEACDLQRGLYAANKAVYFLLRYGIQVTDENGNKPSVFLIDWSEPHKNNFYIAEEVTIMGENTKRPDIVIYVNGIALGVFELKRSTVSLADGIRQNIANQDNRFISHFFTTIQLCFAGNDTEGLKYGTTKTGEKYYLEWKEYENASDALSRKIKTEISILSSRLDKAIYCMCQKERLLDIIHNFIIFDKGIKKTCRHNQYFGVKESEKRIRQEKGGIIWHTQGSGKSLTMVWLSKWILENYPDGRVLIITDREELDIQIEKVFMGVEINDVKRTKSCRDLLGKLDTLSPKVVCSLIHKFGNTSVKNSDKTIDASYAKFVAELEQLSKAIKPKGQIFVFVDECHRTQSGKLHEAMKKILPKSIFVGFTGTPLLKEDKAKSVEIFGSYIHTYKFDEAVQDKVVLDLRYDPRDIPQEILSQEKIDAWFENKTAGLTEAAKATLKARWGTLSNVFSSESRLKRIAVDIIEDFETKPRLKLGNGNAMLVAGSIYQACKYYEVFQNLGFKKCAIITSFNPSARTIVNAIVDDEEETDTFSQYEIYKKMLNGMDVEVFEEGAKNKFISEPAQMKLLIVVDKLLTGFDAPPATYLYIDKSMRDHGLFQAICRVNRLHDESKEFGYIVDYKQLFGKIENAVNNYTNGAFDGYDENDIAGLIKDRLDEAKKSFENALRMLDDLCEGVKYPKSATEYQHFFCGDYAAEKINREIFVVIREKLYRNVSSLVRAYVEIKSDMAGIGYSHKEAELLDKKVKFYVDLKEEIYKASGDYIDLKAYDPGMRFLIDNYIDSKASVRLGMFENLTLVDFIKAEGEYLKNSNKGLKTKENIAEIIENNIRKKVVEKQAVNPKYYEKMSLLLEELIEERKRGVKDYKLLLDKYVELAKKVVTPEETEHYPIQIKSNGALRALYDNFGEDEELARRVHNAVMEFKSDNFRGDLIKEKQIKRELLRILENRDQVEEVFKLICLQEEY